MDKRNNSTENVSQSQFGRRVSIANLLLLIAIILFLLSAPVSAKTMSPSGGFLDTRSELQELGFFPEMFGAGMTAYNNGNYKQALRIWLPMAEAGHTLAEYNLGVAYARGLSVERSVLVASYWWKRAAIQGNPDASYNLGLVYARGEGEITQNLTLAAHWWQQAAIHGDAVAQYNLGMMYAHGEGVRQNIETAINWWEVSANQGFESAKKMLDQIATISE